MKLALVLAAGGRGLRAGTDTPKQFVSVKGKPLIFWTLRAFEGLENLFHIAVGVPENYENISENIIPSSLKGKVYFYAGGSSRCGTVKRGILKLLDFEWDVLLIHDGARPLVKKNDIEKIAEMAYEHGVCVPGAPVRDTLRVVKDNLAVSTVERKDVWEIYTPQAFRKDVIINTLEIWPEESEITDDAALAERAGYQARVVRTDSWNIKITYPEDFTYLKRLL